MNKKEFDKYLLWNVTLAMFMASFMLVFTTIIRGNNIPTDRYLIVNLMIIFTFMITFLTMYFTFFMKYLNERRRR